MASGLNATSFMSFPPHSRSFYMPVVPVTLLHFYCSLNLNNEFFLLRGSNTIINTQIAVNVAILAAYLCLVGFDLWYLPLFLFSHFCCLVLHGENVMSLFSSNMRWALCMMYCDMRVYIIWDFECLYMTTCDVAQVFFPGYNGSLTVNLCNLINILEGCTCLLYFSSRTWVIKSTLLMVIQNLIVFCQFIPTISLQYPYVGKNILIL